MMWVFYIGQSREYFPFDGGGLRRKLVLIFVGIFGCLGLSGCIAVVAGAVTQHSIAVDAARGDVDPQASLYLEACSKDAGAKIHAVVKDVAGYVKLPDVYYNEDGSEQSQKYFDDYEPVECVACGSLLETRWNFYEFFRRTKRPEPKVDSPALGFDARKLLSEDFGWVRYSRVKRPSSLCARFDALGGKANSGDDAEECVVAMSINQPTARYEFQRSVYRVYARVPYRNGSIGGAYLSRESERIRDRITGKVLAEGVSYGYAETVKVRSLMATQNAKYGSYTTVYGHCGNSSLKIEEILIPARPKTPEKPFRKTTLLGLSSQ